MDVDDAFRKLGRPGCYHVGVYFMLCLNYFPVVSNHLAMAIYGATVPHYCALPKGSLRNESIPTKFDVNGQLTTQLDSCSIYANYSYLSNTTQPCPAGWHYESWPRQTSIVMQYDLVCDRAYLSNIANTVYFVGVMLGGPMFGVISDRYGRKPVILFTLYSYIGASVLLVVVNQFFVFVAIRFVIGCLLQGLRTCSYVLLAEFFVPEYRAYVGLSAEIFWGAGVVWLACVSWLLQNWRYIQLALALPSLVTVTYIWILPESVRWLETRGESLAADDVIRRAARVNRLPAHALAEIALAGKSQLHILDVNVAPSDENHPRRLEEEEEVEKEKEEEDKGTATTRRHNVFSMLRHRQMRARSLILFYVWFVIAVGYFGLSFGMTMFGHAYLNLLLCGLFEIPAYVATIPVVTRYGRKLPLCVYLLVGGAMCICAALTHEDICGVNWLLGVGTALMLVGRLAISGCFSILFLYTSELYPTVIRNASLGVCSMWMKFGAAVAPLVILLGDAWFSWVPLVIYGTLALIGCLLAAILPETHNCHLADTIEDATSGKMVHNRTKYNSEENSIKEPLNKYDFKQ